MKLNYRGVSYEKEIAAPLQAEYERPAVDLKYRGASYRLGEVAKVERLGVIFKYRGATYTQQPIAQPEVAPVAEPVASLATSSIDERARLLTLSHNRAVRNRHHAMLVRNAAQVGFSANLANYWNQMQGEIETALWTNYDRSNAALS